MSKRIRIFLSSPNDVPTEQADLRSLVAELNDFFTFLAPEQDVSLEVIQYETHVYPDVGGAPQSVIDQQIPRDYEIHFGIMWKRSGTPTSTAESGTIHEFDLALKRREAKGHPIIMFYFSDESIGMPTSDAELQQLQRVIKFRERLALIGLTVTYPDRHAFRDRARIGLLRAIADLLRKEPSLPPVHDKRTSRPAGVPSEISALAAKYDATRRDMSSGAKRTQVMTQIFSDMRNEAPKAKRALDALLTDASAGHRLAAVAILQVFPDIDYISWLADRLEPDLENPFVGYEAAVALLQAARSFPQTLDHQVRDEVLRARELAIKNPHDPPRIRALDYALKELEIKSRSGA